jgi:hypothetical protein
VFGWGLLSSRIGDGELEVTLRKKLSEEFLASIETPGAEGRPS